MSTIVTRAGKGAALTWTEGDANITNLNNDKIEAVADDTAPQLGGDLNVNGHKITSASNGDVEIVPNGTGQLKLNGTTYPSSNPSSGQVLTATNGTGALAWQTPTSGGASNLSDLGDVALSGPPSDGQHLVYSTTYMGWRNTTVSGGSGTVTSVSGTGTVSGLTLSGTVTSSGSLTLGGTLSLTSGNVTTALGYTPYNSTNPSGYTTNTGTVTSVGGTGTVNGLTLTGTVTSSGSLTLGGTLDLTTAPAIGSSSANTGKFTSLQFTNPIEPVYDLGTTGGTIAPNAANGSVQKITLNSALTINAFTSPVAGQSVTLIIYGGTSYTSITSTMKFAGGVKTLTATSGCIDIVSIYYDGTNYLASLAKGFA